MKNEITKWIGLGITILTLVVGAVVWASNEHGNIMDSARQEFINKEFSRSVYAPREDVVRIDQRTQNIEEDIDNINKSLDNVENKLDRLIGHIMQGKGNDNDSR